MKKGLRKVIGIILAVTMMATLSACGSGGGVPIDYADAESFEGALNAGDNLEGKVVQFTAMELHPDSAMGYNVWAGEHLNFISSRNPDIKAGDMVVVKANEITSSLGSWFITYEKVSNGKITDATISSGSSAAGADTVDMYTEATDTSVESGDDSASAETNNSGGTASFSTGNTQTSASSEKPLELTDYGWYINEPSSYDGTVYVDFCGMIYNPNESLFAEFPEVLVTVKNGDGSIMATKEQMGMIIMPEDTITLCGMFSMPVGDLSDDAQIIFDVEWSDFTTSTSLHENVRTTDFVFSNVSEHEGSGENLITGEITNNSSVDIDTANVSIVLRKDGEIVYMEDTFVDGLRAGKTKAFEFQRYHEWPEHDTIDCSAQAW